MADKIKKFFQKKKADAKFKLAGPGHKLNQSTTSVRAPESKNAYKAIPRSELSAEAKHAAEAALARMNTKKNDAAFNTSLAAIQAQVKRELEAEKKASAATSKSTPPSERKNPKTEFEASPLLAVSGVCFRCTIISNEVLSKDDWKIKIREFLYEQLAEERGLTACLMIHSLNNNREKIQACIETLCKYLENIMANPTEEKYHRIRMTNRLFCERVQPIEGSSEFLFAAGFRQQKMKIQDVEEDFLVFSSENLEGDDQLQLLCDALRSAEPIPLELDRNLQVLSPSQAAKRVELPPVFYTISPEELKKEQQLRTEAMEKTMQLRTKAMREKDELREMRKYRFALLRIRFPDGIYLQGTFGVYEKFSAVLNFIRDNLEYENMPFILTNATGQRLMEEEDGDKSLVDLRLVPATILTFAWDPAVSEELSAHGVNTYLKPELLMLVQSL